MVRDLLTALGLDLNFYEKFIEWGDGPYKGCTDLMVDMCTYEYTNLSWKGHVKPEESFMDTYVEECFKSEKVHSSTRRLRKILDAKYG